ncbi:MAG: methyltransferase domain-containing protein [Synechococcus sp.]
MTDFPLEQGYCHVCGKNGVFIHEINNTRKGYKCPHCSASLQYRHQAKVILDSLSNRYKSFAEFSQTSVCENLSIYEPGIAGPFRKYLRQHSNYQQSYFWPDISTGEEHDGIRCENLESSTFADNSFDLVISSDILDCVRKPYDAFAEIYRILRPGGCHIFSISLTWPPSQRTIKRVDVDREDTFLMPPIFQSSPVNKSGSLVYNNFGEDLISTLGCLGYEVEVTGLSSNRTFLTRKPSLHKQTV